MTVADLDAVLAIERASFSQPWTLDMFRAELTENRSARFLVGVAGDDIVGYIGGWLVLDELQVVSLAVRPDARRCHVASRLLAHLFDHAGDRLRRVPGRRRSNQAAIDV
jgi:ribosomal-protein-alanine N-acetyltransferase